MDLRDLIPFLKNNEDAADRDLTEAEEKTLRRQVAKVTGQSEAEVDLDAPLFTSGQHYRSYRRAVVRDQAKRKAAGQRKFKRQWRAQQVHDETLEAQQRIIEGPDTPMKRNVQQAHEQTVRLMDCLQQREARREERRAAHEARRAALGQTPDGRPA